MAVNELGELIKKQRKSKNITQKELAKKINKSERMVQKYENGEVTPSIDILEKIGVALGAFFFTFNNDDINENYGIDTFVLNENLAENFPIDKLQYLFPNSKKQFDINKQYYVIRLCNNSMNSLFPSNSELIIEKCNQFVNNKILAVLTGDNEVLVRKVTKKNNIITLIPLTTNDEFIPRIYDLNKDKIEVIGIVKAALNFY